MYFFLSHPTVTHASENTSATEENTNVSHEENHATSESNNIDNTEDSTNESNDEVTNTSEDNKETDKDTNSANNEYTAPSDNSSTANNADENDSEDTNKPTADTSTDTETKESSTAGSESPANTTNEDDSDDSAYSDPEAKYDTSKDPNYDEEGILKDTRKKLANMDVENDNYTGEIENLKHGIGTGSVIGNKYILTAAHVIYNNNYPKGYMTGGYVVPGKHDGREPFGRYKIKNLYVHDKYKETPYSRYDIGIIEIEPHEDAVESIIELTPYNIKPFNMNMIGKKVKMPGYPIDKIKESVDQWGVDGTIIRKLERGTIEYSMFDHPGLSGSPVFLEDNADDIVAVHTFGTQGNEYGTLGTPITKKIYNWIQSIINKDADQPNSDDNSDKPAEQPNSDNNSDKPAEQPNSDADSDKPVEQPNSDDNSDKPAEQPKAHNTSILEAKATQINNTDKAVNNTQITTSQTSNEAKAEAQSYAKQDNKQLPKTGENEAVTTTLFGTLFAMLGSLLFFRKRKTDK